MIYIIAGAPGTNKQQVADKLRDFLNEGECADTCYEVVEDMTARHDFTFLSDYREDLLLSAHRATRLVRDRNLIFTHTLLDSLAYAGVHVQDLFKNDQANAPDIARWSIVFDASLQMLVDSFNPVSDHGVLLIPYTGDDETSRDLDGALHEVLDTLELRYTEIDTEAGAGEWISN